MGLYADSLWDARKAIPTDHLLVAATTTSSSPSCDRADRRSQQQNRCSQTPGPSNSECYFHKCFGPAANNVTLLAVSREMPEPMGGGKIKQPLSRFYGYLMYLQDALSNRDYLVDTGASRSVFPHRSSAAPTGPRLLMADGRPTKA